MTASMPPQESPTFFYGLRFLSFAEILNALRRSTPIFVTEKPLRWCYPPRVDAELLDAGVAHVEVDFSQPGAVYQRSRFFGLAHPVWV
jgi:hypothetical protein